MTGGSKRRLISHVNTMQGTTKRPIKELILLGRQCNFTFVQTVQLKSQFSETSINQLHRFFEIFVQFTVNIEGSACFSILLEFLKNNRIKKGGGWTICDII